MRSNIHLITTIVFISLNTISCVTKIQENNTATRMEYFEKYDEGRLNIYRENHLRKVFYFIENLSNDYSRINTNKEYVLMSVEFIVENKIPYYLFNFYAVKYEYNFLDLIDYYNLDESTLIQVKLKINTNNNNVITHEDYYINARNIELTSTSNRNIFFEKSLFLSELNNQRERSVIEAERRMRDLFYAIDYILGDSLDTIRRKNPRVIFNDTGIHQGHQLKTIVGNNNITRTEVTITFDGNWRLFNVIITKYGAALDVYEPLFERYTRIHGRPKSNTPFNTNLSRNVSSATASFESENGYATLLLVVPLSGREVPWVMLIEGKNFDN